jgi:asparagine synthase (glutamine-hydrolysing)
MRSDVPVGSCLSGGMDSSAIVCLMAKLFPQTQVKTFTAGFDDPRFDETRWANAVSRAVGAQAHRSTPSEQAFLDDLDALIWHQDEPFFSASVYAQWCVMRSARQAGVPVLLDGQGADEAMLGYKKFYFFYLRNLIAKGNLLKAGREAFALAMHGDRGALRWREALRYLPKALRPKNSSLADYLTRSGTIARAARPLQLGSGGDMEQRQIDDLTLFSVPSLLRYEDRNSMAWSIESRVPFLDYRLAEFLVGLPTEFKLRGGKTKAVMRTAMTDIIPAPVLNRRDKMGFVTPQSVWMAGRLGERMVGEITQSSALAGLLDTKAIVANWHRADPSRRNTMQAGVFRAGLFAIWAKRFGVTTQ